MGRGIGESPSCRKEAGIGGLSENRSRAASELADYEYWGDERLARSREFHDPDCKDEQVAEVARRWMIVQIGVCPLALPVTDSVMFPRPCRQVVETRWG